jgi:hypothetical protein
MSDAVDADEYEENAYGRTVTKRTSGWDLNLTHASKRSRTSPTSYSSEAPQMSGRIDNVMTDVAGMPELDPVLMNHRRVASMARKDRQQIRGNRSGAVPGHLDFDGQPTNFNFSGAGSYEVPLVSPMSATFRVQKTSPVSLMSRHSTVRPRNATSPKYMFNGLGGTRRQGRSPRGPPTPPSPHTRARQRKQFERDFQKDEAMGESRFNGPGGDRYYTEQQAEEQGDSLAGLWGSSTLRVPARLRSPTEVAKSYYIGHIERCLQTGKFTRQQITQHEHWHHVPFETQQRLLKDYAHPIAVAEERQRRAPVYASEEAVQSRARRTPYPPSKKQGFWSRLKDFLR